MTAAADAPTAGTATADRPDWAQYLVRLRKQRGLAAREVADLIGITQQTYAGIEAGTRKRNGRRVPVTPREDTLQRLAEALDLTGTEREQLFTLAALSRGNRKPWQARLKAARLAAHVTQAEAAAVAGVTLDTYRGWERRETTTPRREPLRTLLAHLGWTEAQVAEFMTALPPEAPARAPQQPSKPVSDLPRWSQFLTQKRLAAGLYLSQVDALVGQQSVVRRFELGGWPRSDGRRSVPSIAWLDRIADALAMTTDDRAHLHLLADHQRLAVAAQGGKPLVSELLHEARKAVDVTRAEANTRVDLPTGTWNRLELGDPAALAALTSDLIATTVARLPIRPLLATALAAAVPNRDQPADINT